MTASQASASESDAVTLTHVLDAYGIEPGRVRELFATLILLRWIDYADALESLEAVFEDRHHDDLLPPELQWRNWCEGDALRVGRALAGLCRHLKTVKSLPESGAAAHLGLLADPVSRIAEANPVYLTDAVHWLNDQRFETVPERRKLLERFDSILTETATPYEGESATPPSVTQLVAALANVQPGQRVLDPCFGLGGFLVETWRRAERNKGPGIHRPGPIVDISGVELNSSSFLIGLTRLLLAGVESPRLALGDSLERDPASSPQKDGFDVVLANPPIGAKTTKDSWRYRQFAVLTPDLTGLFVQQALAQLSPTGRAVIAVPDGFLFRGGAERELRQQLVERGQVEAVIGLPAGVFLPYTSVKGSLLLLRKQGGADRVRMLDAAQFFEPAKGKKPATLRAVLAEQLAQAVRSAELPGSDAARALPADADGPGTGRLARSIWEVTASDLAVADWDLQPRRRDKGALDELLANIGEALHGRGKVAPLSSAGEVLAGRSIKATDLNDEPMGERPIGYVRIKDISKGRISAGTSWIRPTAQATVEPSWRLRPADVVLSKSGTIGKAGIVRNGAIGAVAANGLYVIRVDQALLDPNFLVAYLASPACQSWLVAQSRGAVIQHLNREVLDRLPVPLAPLPMQAQAAAQHQEFGTDVLWFLAQYTGAVSRDQLTPLLAETIQKVPEFIDGLDEVPSLQLLAPILERVKRARNLWAHSSESSMKVAAWLPALLEILLRLQDVASLPRGPSLLSVAQDAERGFAEIVAQAGGHTPVDGIGRTLAEKLRQWLRAVVSSLISDARIRVTSEVSQLRAGQTVELSLLAFNDGALPLRSLRIESRPDWGAAEFGFVAEQSSVPVLLRGDAPKVVGEFAMVLRWRAKALDGSEVGDEIQLSFDVQAVVEGEAHREETADLGGSPYVAGPPLQPKSGNEVFYGREGLIERISRQVIRHGNVVLLEGNRRAGKTSILRHLEGTAAIPGWLAVYASLQGTEGAEGVVGVPTATVFREMATTIATGLIKLGIETPLPDGTVIAAGAKALGVAKACRRGISQESPFTDFREYLEVALGILAEHDLSLLLMLDEFDKLQEGIDNGVTSPQVPENIRFLIQTYPRFSAILTGSRRLKRLREEYWSALYGLGTSIQVTALEPEDARRVVVEPVRGKLSFSADAVERVLSLTARQPFLIQSLCNRIFDFAAMTRTRAITVTTVDEAAKVLVADNEHFASLWDYAAHAEPTGRCRRQYLLYLCADAFRRGLDIDYGGLKETLAQHGIEADDEALILDLDRLRELELLELGKESGERQYRLAIPMMGDWINDQHDPAVLRTRARVEAEEEHA